MDMTTALERIVIGREIDKQHAAFEAAANDPNVTGEQLSAMMGANNRILLGLMERLPIAIEHLQDAAVDQALATGFRLANAALPHTDPEFVPDLFEGVNVMAARAHQAAGQGAPLQMNYMDPGVRKMIFLAESGLRHIEVEEEKA